MARFLQLSDLHVAAPGRAFAGSLDTAAILSAAIDRLLARWDAIGPIDAVLLSGDLSDDGTAESYERVRAELGRLGRKLLAVPGNHDARDVMRAAFADLKEMPARGLIDWVVDIGDTRIIGLDTLIEGEGGGRLREESLERLAAAVSANEAEAILVMMHHPPMRTGLAFMDAIWLENAPVLLAALSGARVPATIVAGHVHGQYHGMLGPHTVCTAPAVSCAFSFDQREAAPARFMEGPTGCLLIETGQGGIVASLSLDRFEGPFAL
jgi:Icc protein